MASRGTDDSTERRKLRPREEADALGRFLEDTFDSVGEHTLAAVPSLLWAALAVPPRQSTAMLAGYVALIAGLAVVRGNRLSRGDGGRGLPRWPDATVRLLLARVGYYNLAVVALASAATARVAPGWGESPVSLAAVGAFGLVVGACFPVVAAAVVRLTGGGPRARPRDWNTLRMDRERNRRGR